MNTEFMKFITLIGNQSKAGKFLGLTEGMISRMKTGDRKISPAIAEIINREYPEVSFSGLLLNKKAA